MRVLFQQPFPNDSQDRFCLLEHLPVVEPQHREAGLCQRGRAPLIGKHGFGLKVLSAVQFNNQAGFEAGEIGDTSIANGMLSAKFCACQTAVAQVMP